MPTLSKSKYIDGLFCHKRLYLSAKHPDYKTPPTPSVQQRFDNGHRANEMAQKNYPGGKWVDAEQGHQKAVARTQALLKQNIPAIFEAAFTYDNVNVRVDILEREGKGWNLIEVKTSTSVKNEHIDDAAVQLYVLKNCGIPISKIYLMLVNNQYVLGQSPPEEILISKEITDEVRKIEAEIPPRVAQFNQLIAQPTIPDIPMGPHCKKPHRCPFWEYCEKSRPKHHISTLYWLLEKKYADLRNKNITTLYEIPPDFDLTEKQARQRDCIVQGKEFIDPHLENDLKELEYPIHYLDFESINPCFPLYQGTRPYQQIVFQYSIHILSRSGEVAHKEFLHTQRTDPRPAFLNQLIQDLGSSGTICVYHTFEKSRLTELAKEFPECSSEINAIIDRLWDLCKTITENYYHPDFEGSFSIKRILPILIPDMNYKGLAIQDGEDASVQYMKMIAPETSPEEKVRIEKALRDYCALDTLAMVKLHQTLFERVKKHS